MVVCIHMTVLHLQPRLMPATLHHWNMLKITPDVIIFHTHNRVHTQKKSINHQLSVKLIHGLHGLAIKVGHHNVQYATTSRGSSMHLSSHQSCVRLYLVRGSDSTSWLQIRAKASVDCCEKFHISAEVVYLDCHSFCYSRRQHTVYIRTHSLPSTLYTVTHVS